MDSFEFNKILGGLLGTVFVVFSISIASEAIFASPVPEKPGYAIEAAEAEPTAAGGGAAEQAKPIAELLAHADAKAGEAVFKKCTACHSGEKGGPNKVGPDLWDIVNRPIAGHAGFSYSAGMKDFAQGGTVHWDYDHLNHFLTSPKGYVKGTAMGFAGIKKDDERANLIAYLRTLSDNPAPLPEAGAAPAAPAEGAAPAAPAEGAAPAAPEAPAAPAEGGAAQPAPAQ
ncbi:cytochrome c family protein [Mesorhizobium sp. KR2-14]|uniref:c-type cytochrome n=1 Tax=Mesorhizobium sp. KR2-14 TaxID=3156610 RepID=UPI0032B3E454